MLWTIFNLLTCHLIIYTLRRLNHFGNTSGIDGNDNSSANLLKWNKTLLDNRATTCTSHDKWLWYFYVHNHLKETTVPYTMNITKDPHSKSNKGFGFVYFSGLALRTIAMRGKDFVQNFISSLCFAVPLLQFFLFADKLWTRRLFCYLWQNDLDVRLNRMG